MKKFEGIELLKYLCDILGPTGSEERVADAVREQLSDIEGLQIKYDKGGNLIVRYACGIENAR